MGRVTETRQKAICQAAEAGHCLTCRETLSLSTLDSTLYIQWASMAGTPVAIVNVA